MTIRKTPTVLVVEDDTENRTAIVKVLEGDGYKVLQTDNGQQALDIIREARQRLANVELPEGLKLSFLFDQSVFVVNAMRAVIFEGLIAAGLTALLILLFLSAVVCIVLGMGLPTVGVYVLLAALVAPSLIEVGVQPIAAHMYVMYFGMMSMITPPIAIAAFAAASLAGADAMRTGFAACRFGWTAFIVPVLFVFSPSLLLIGGTWTIAWAFFTALVGVWLISIAFVGHFQRPLTAMMRLLFVAFGMSALIPADMFGGVLLDSIGVAGGAVLIGYEYILGRRRRAASTSTAASANGRSAWAPGRRSWRAIFSPPRRPGWPARPSPMPCEPPSGRISMLPMRTLRRYPAGRSRNDDQS